MTQKPYRTECCTIKIKSDDCDCRIAVARDPGKPCFADLQSSSKRSSVVNAHQSLEAEREIFVRFS